MKLEQILKSKREEISSLRARAPELAEAAGEAPPPRGFATALRAGATVRIIAEFKRRSPSAGPIAPDADPAKVAAAYAAGGAAALSVLTDGPGFGGGLGDLAAAREASGLPVLRKDFILDPLQVIESRAAGADAILLLVRTLTDRRLRDLLGACDDAGLTALVEAHDAEELARAVAAGAGLVGVNARDLSTFEVSLAAGTELVGDVPPDRLAVAESGISGREDVRRAARAGADAALVGSWLMLGDPAERVRALTGVPKTGRGSSDAAGGWSGGRAGVAVKICGCRTPEDALTAVEAGASYVGLVFAGSPRRVDTAGAGRIAAAVEGAARRVGVFVDAPVEQIRAVAAEVPLEVVQLHGTESPRACAELRAAGLEVWKAVRPRDAEELGFEVERFEPVVDAVLVEGFSAGAAGGTGARVPLEWLAREPGTGGRRPRHLVLAGGLNPSNVGEAVRAVDPEIVDVSSGVERVPGEKDPGLIRRFVRGVRTAVDRGRPAGEDR